MSHCQMGEAFHEATAAAGASRVDTFGAMIEDERFLPPDRPPRKPGQEPTARLTLDAYVRLRRELEELRTEGRARVGERLLRARELGDIRENAEYDAAKDDQGLMEARIRDLIASGQPHN